MVFLATQEHRAVHHEGGNRDSSPLPERRRGTSLSIFYDGHVVSQRVRHRLEPRPHGGLPHLGDRFGRSAHLCHEVFDCLTPATRRNQVREVSRATLRYRGTTIVNDERRLVQRQFCDPGGEQAGCLQGQDSAGGMTKDEGRSASFADQRVEVFDLTLDCVGWRVPALAATTPVVGVDGEVWRKARRKAGRVRSPGYGTGHQDEGGSLTRLIERDKGAIFGKGLFHTTSFFLFAVYILMSSLRRTLDR